MNDKWWCDGVGYVPKGDGSKTVVRAFELRVPLASTSTSSCRRLRSAGEPLSKTSFMCSSSRDTSIGDTRYSCGHIFHLSTPAWLCERAAKLFSLPHFLPAGIVPPGNMHFHLNACYDVSALHLMLQLRSFLGCTSCWWGQHQ